MALAVALILNVTAPSAFATPAIPRTPGRQRDDAAPHDNATVLPVDPVLAEHSGVEIVPVAASPIKTDYHVPDLLRALASSGEPFRQLGKSVGDTYAVLSGDELSAQTRDTLERAGSFMDAITGLIPSVQNLRIGGHVAGLSADAYEGKPVSPEQTAEIVQFGDPRGLGANLPLHTRIDGMEASRPASPLHVAAKKTPESPIERVSVHAAEAVPSENVDAQASKPRLDRGGPTELEEPAAHIGDGTRLRHIDGEDIHLQGYALPLDEGDLPFVADDPSQLQIVNGRHYLAGEAGYYHVTHEPRADHWLVNAPRGTRAQVPVTFDPVTRKWRADAPLRLCGGGCGPSRESTPDSIALSRNVVAQAIRHIADRDIRDAIQQAYSDLAHLHLMRTNREDLRALRDNSIVGHRRILLPQLMRLDPHATLFEQQREAALITAVHYDTYLDTGVFELSPEAFCQENAEILFHYLLTRGVPGAHLRMITVRPQGLPPHVMVLYTESDQFIDLLDLSTPQPPVKGEPDGVVGERFIASVFLTRDSTVFLDPWSRVKASSFADADDLRTMMDMFEVALEDSGLRLGTPFRVSITRPYPEPRASFPKLLRDKGAIDIAGPRSLPGAGSPGSAFRKPAPRMPNHTEPRPPLPPLPHGDGDPV
ncbi:hypothetical protein [Pandoraea pnomenusa]|uniref:hypothetical protein n=1 Tax=Pandoraea pnomenusa TaxID=93220 RepID=UPI00333FF18A